MMHRRQHPRAFSLIEVLMALALGGMVLTAAAAFLFGIFNITLMAEREPLFDEHVESTTRFLEYAFLTALPDEDKGGTSNRDRQGNAGQNTSPVAWKALPGGTGLNPEALAFKLNGDLPIFVPEDMAYIPEVECFLVLDEGLTLRWRTEAMRQEDADALLSSRLSPFVTGLTYYYYDREDDSWEDSDEAETADEGGQLLPDFIGLTFQHPDGREATRKILLPANHDTPLP